MKSGRSGADFWTTALDRRQRDGKDDHVQPFRRLFAEQAGQAQRRTDDEEDQEDLEWWGTGEESSRNL